MSKSPDAFRTISEVADWLGVQAHVLRFWESKFSQVKPVKRAGGRRYYRPADMQLLGGIKRLLHDDGLTIKGVQKLLREQGIAEVAALSPPMEETLDGEANADGLAQIASGDATTGSQTQATGRLGPDFAEQAGSDPVAARADEAPESKAPSLPSFMSRGGADVPARPKIPDISATEPPPESEIEYVPGPLSKLSGLTSLSPEQTDKISVIVANLRKWAQKAHPEAAQ